MTLSLVMHPELVECTLSSSKGALSGLDRDWLGGGSSQGSTLDGTRGEILRIGPELSLIGVAIARVTRSAKPCPRAKRATDVGKRLEGSRSISQLDWRELESHSPQSQ